MTPEEQIFSVESQIIECAEGNSKEIICPYCGTVNVATNESLCCDLLGKAVVAILDRLRFLEAKGNVERILDQAARN